MSVQFFNGVPIDVPNRITRTDPKFYVSYNPSARDYGTDTTALYIHETGQFLILAGNHATQYDGLSFADALAYFYANVDKAVSQSDHGRVFRFVDGKAFYEQGGY